MSGSLHKLDHVSKTAKEDWTTEEAFERGLGRRTRWPNRQHTGGMGTRSKSLVMSSTNRMKRTGPSTEPWGDPTSDAERAAVGTTNLDFSSTIRKEGAHPKNEAKGEFEREEFVKKSTVPDRVKSLGEVNRSQIVRSGGCFL